MKEQKKRTKNLAQEAKDRGEGQAQVTSDVLGSYTGVPEDGEMPVQDADDL